MKTRYKFEVYSREYGNKNGEVHWYEHVIERKGSTFKTVPAIRRIFFTGLNEGYDKIVRSVYTNNSINKIVPIITRKGLRIHEDYILG